MSAPTPAGVAVVGSITADVTAFAPRLPQPGETILGDAATLVLGGKGANQAVAAARAGAPTWMVGCVGSDGFQELTRGGLASHGVNTEYVKIVPGPTGLAHIRVNIASGQNDIVMVPLANSQLSGAYAEESLRKLAGEVSVVLLQLEAPAETTVHIAQVAHSLGMTVVLDPAPAQELPAAVWPFLDIITPNETEASILTGIDVVDWDSAAAAAGALQAKGVDTVIITRAEHGSLILSPAGSWRSEPFAVTAVDTTAAGDAFAGVLGQSLAAGMDFSTAVRRAGAAGALAVTVKGASPSLPAAAQIEGLLAQN